MMLCAHCWPVESNYEFSANHYCSKEEGHDGPLHLCECGAEHELEVAA